MYPFLDFFSLFCISFLICNIFRWKGTTISTTWKAQQYVCIVYGCGCHRQWCWEKILRQMTRKLLKIKLHLLWQHDESNSSTPDIQYYIRPYQLLSSQLNWIHWHCVCVYGIRRLYFNILAIIFHGWMEDSYLIPHISYHASYE